jgi:hypothetical protein
LKYGSEGSDILQQEKEKEVAVEIDAGQTHAQTVGSRCDEIEGSN